MSEEKMGLEGQESIITMHNRYEERIRYCIEQLRAMSDEITERGLDRGDYTEQEQDDIDLYAQAVELLEQYLRGEIDLDEPHRTPKIDPF
jgi:hypothetical protein